MDIGTVMAICTVTNALLVLLRLFLWKDEPDYEAEVEASSRHMRQAMSDGRIEGMLSDVAALRIRPFGGDELTSLEGKAREVWVNERIREKAGLPSPHDFTYEDVERAIAAYDLHDDLFANPRDYRATRLNAKTTTFYADGVAYSRVGIPCYEVTRRDGGMMHGFYSLKVFEVPEECVESVGGKVMGW